MALIATGSQHTVSYVAESTYGTTPSTPAYTPIPFTGTTLGMQKDSIVSNKLRSDRQIEDLRHGNKSASGDITAELEYGSFDDLLQAMSMGTWASDVLTSGTTRRSFTLERYFGNLDTPEYHRYTGCEVNTMSMTVAPNAMVETTFGFIGQDVSTGTARVTGSTDNSVTDYQPFDSFTGSITEGGSAIATVTQIDLNWTNGLETAYVIGTDTTIQPSDSKSNLTGTLTAFFTSSALYDKFLNETSSEIVFTLTDPAGNDLQFDIPNVKYNAGNPDVSGEGRVTVALEFQALYNSGDSSQIVITRTAA
jgi:hypothetical protein